MRSFSETRFAGQWLGLVFSLTLALAAVAAVQLFVLVVRAAPPGAPDGTILEVTGDDTAEDFYEGDFFRTGTTRRSTAEGGDGNGDLSLLSIGVVANWNISDTTALPNLDSHTVEIYKDQTGEEHLYVIGGYYGVGPDPPTDHPEIYSATIRPESGPNGEDLLSEWQQLSTTQLPVGRSEHTSAIVNDYLYVIGGYANGTITDSVQYAPIAPQNGAIGSFQSTAALSVTSLSFPYCNADGLPENGRRQMAATVVSGTLFVIAGAPNGTSLEGSHCVFYGTPDPNTGKISSWNVQTNYPQNFYGNAAVSYEDIIYSSAGGTADVHRATPALDSLPPGDITNWITETHSLPAYRRHAAAIVYNGQILIIGGTGTSGSAQGSVFANFFNPGGSLDGQWITSNPLQGKRVLHDAVVSSRGWVYVIGGIDNTNTSTDDVFYDTLVGEASQYAPYGEYESAPIILDPTDTLRELRWVTYVDPAVDLGQEQVTVTVDYRYADSKNVLTSAPWLTTTGPITQTGVTTHTHLFSDTPSPTYFQYRVRMGTTQTDTTPIVQRVEVVYEVPPPDLRVQKSTEAGPTGRGETLTYTIQHWNVGIEGSGTPTEVRITDTLPAYVEVITSSPLNFQFLDFITRTETVITDTNIGPFSTTKQYKRYVATVSELPPGITPTTALVARVTDTLDALPLEEENPQIVNEVKIGYAGPDADAGNNEDSTVNDLALPKLTITKDKDPSGGVAPGQTIVYTLAYFNTSNYTATEVFVSDQVPTNTTFVSAAGGDVLDVNTQPHPTVRWEIGDVGPNTQNEVTLTVRVTTSIEDIDNFEVRNVATIDSRDTTPKLSNGVFNTVRANPEILLTKSVLPQQADADEILTFSIHYTNVGDVGLEGVIITDTVPSHTSYVSGSASSGGTFDSESNQVRWNIDTIPLGGNGTVHFQARVDSLLPANTTSVENVAWGQTETISPFKTEPAAAIIDTKPEFAISKAATPDVVAEAGDEIEYTIVYTNIGAIGATGIVVTDRLPANTTLIDAGGATVVGDDRLVWERPAGEELAGGGGSGQVSYRVQVTEAGIAAGSVVNEEYEIGSTQGVTASGDPVTVAVIDLAVSKEVFPTTAEAGDLLTYTIRYTNTGNASLSSLHLVDTVPTYTTYVTDTISGPGTEQGNPARLQWAVGTVSPGQSGIAQFQVRVDKPLPAAAQELSNQVEVSAEGLASFTTLPTITPITSKPVLKITKVAEPRSGILPGDHITFTLFYTNVGAIGAAVPVITDRVPANTTLIDAGGGTLDGGVLSWQPVSELAGLGGHGSVQFVVRVESIASGGIANEDYGSVAPQQGVATTGAPVYVSPGADFAAVRLVGNQRVFRPQESTSLQLSVDVTNYGGEINGAADGIWVDLYVYEGAPTPPASAGELSNVNTYWFVRNSAVMDGKIHTLTSDGDGVTGPGASAYPSGSLAAGTYYAYAQVNTDDDDPSDDWPVEEWPRANNIVGPYVFTVTNALESAAPTIDSVTPDASPAADGLHVTVSGANFQEGARVYIERDGDVRTGYDVQVNTSGELEATFDMAGQLAGAWDVVVTNPDGGTGILPKGFTLLSGSQREEACSPACAIYLPSVLRQ